MNSYAEFDKAIAGYKNAEAYQPIGLSMNCLLYTSASFIPLEWDGTKLVKALLASMDVSQEKKAEIESHKALKDAYRATENASRAKTEFLSNMSHDIRTRCV